VFLTFGIGCTLISVPRKVTLGLWRQPPIVAWGFATAAEEIEPQSHMEMGRDPKGRILSNEEKNKQTKWRKERTCHGESASGSD
jgi:hypothetical protein